MSSQSHSNNSRFLSLKLIFLSYFNIKQHSNLLNDCHNAIDKQTHQLNKKAKAHLEQIKSIVQQQQQNGKKIKNKKQMDIILEEEFTQRSNDENYKIKFDQKYFMKKFNSTISGLKNSEQIMDQIVFLYKTQLKDLATELTQSKRTINVLSDELKELRQENFKFKKSINDHNHNHPIHQNFVGKRRNSTSNIQNQEDQLFTREPPKPYDNTKNKQNYQTSNKIVQSYNNTNYIQKNKWNQLSSKITSLKNKLTSYESQLIQKQEEINKLNEQLKKSKLNCDLVQSEEKKKLKSLNTTLRGQKIMLENQIHSLKKKVKQEQQIMNAYEIQNKKLKLDVQNLESTVKWHLNTINDLRNNFSQGLKEDAGLLNKLKQSQQSNKKLLQTVENQQIYLKQYNKKLDQIQASYNKKIQSQKQKIDQLQHMIDLKNQTIIKIKANSNNKLKQTKANQANQSNNDFSIQHQTAQKQKSQKYFQKTNTLNKTQKMKYQVVRNSFQSHSLHKDLSYYTQMIRVLTKKLQQRQQIIRNQNIVIRQMRQGYIYNTFHTQME